MIRNLTLFVLCWLVVCISLVFLFYWYHRIFMFDNVTVISLGFLVIGGAYFGFRYFRKIIKRQD
jgi:tetraacyldisaccharide-1-P 4'-kinase